MRRLSPREARRLQERLFRQMGMNVKELGEAKSVTIEFDDRVLVITEPSVVALEMPGQTVFQVVGGEVSEQKPEAKPLEIPEEDVLLVAQQAGVSPEEARQALEETEGDLAQAILLLQSRRQ